MKQKEKEARANAFVILPPRPGRSLFGPDTLDDWMHETAAVSDTIAQAAVRDGDPSIDVLVMMRGVDGTVRFLPWQERGAAVAADAPPSREEARRIARQKLRLPAAFSRRWRIDGIIRELEEVNSRFLPRWQEAPLLRGELVLLLDENLTASLADTTLRYSRENGLTVRGRKAMREKEFILLEEPWLRVRSPDCAVREVSLTDALLHAHEATDLAGELPAQDAAVLRLLLAVLHTVFSCVDEQGIPAPFQSEEDAVARWGALWRLGRFPEEPLRRYLETWRERFWLFHPERPFWQVPQAKIGTEYTAAKLNGELSESGNKIRLFPPCSGEEKNGMGYAQAARWLLYVNGYDDTSSKPKTKGAPSVGAGWLGKLGLIQAVGSNLFETLMLMSCKSSVKGLNQNTFLWQCCLHSKQRKLGIQIRLFKWQNSLKSLIFV